MKIIGHLNLFQKFILVMIIGAILPMVMLSTLIMNRIFTAYESALLDSYEQSLDFVAGSLTNDMAKYDEILKLLYYYMEANEEPYALRYDNVYTIKSILEIEASDTVTEAQAIRQRNLGMETFLRYVALTDQDIASAFFIDYQDRIYGYAGNSYFYGTTLLKEAVDFRSIDHTSKEMSVYPTHINDYFKNKDNQVYSLSRNYFDLSGAVGKYKYLGSLFIEIDIKALERLFSNSEIYNKGNVYIVDQSNICIFSNNKELIAMDIEETVWGNDIEDDFLITDRELDNGWRIVYKIPYGTIFNQIKALRNIMFVILLGAVVSLMMSSIAFSRKMTQPIRTMIGHMGRIESGDLDISIPVVSNDEFGTLSKRFNQMAKELKTYIDKSYIAQIKQREAELTALKSQIYPHFLYNTLEVIRMTAVDHEDMIVSEMIEALADQIHYIIGQNDDMVILEKEVDIVRKYLFLLNCRITAEIDMKVSMSSYGNFQVPQLILQPVVENAYIHGFKPKQQSGKIEITCEIIESDLHIIVMDNGEGMTQEKLFEVRERLNSNERGIRDEDTWHSIGLKNVHDRISHLYGRQYGIEIESTQGLGTLVIIKLPIIEVGNTTNDIVEEKEV